jgi:redox-sensitive bicupin YhaK (pirin superfamily)
VIRIRKSDERGHFSHGWLDTYHTFSFDHYYDPNFMGFRSLRVINEDRVQPGMGFPTHPHSDMEILTYLLEGALQHRDSMGTGSIIRPGELQRMNAGTGITHSEFNASRTEPVHLLQIWLLPERKGLKPSYEQKAFPEAERRGRLRLVASHDGRDGSLTVHQDVSLYAGLLEPGQKVTHRLEPGRSAWVQVARGKVQMNGSALEVGDGAAISKQQEIELGSEDAAEILLFDLA